MWLAMHYWYIPVLTGRDLKDYWATNSTKVVISKCAFVASVLVCAAIPFAIWPALIISMLLFVAHGIIVIGK
jgi:hypothetical protein